MGAEVAPTADSARLPGLCGEQLLFTLNPCWRRFALLVQLRGKQSSSCSRCKRSVTEELFGAGRERGRRCEVFPGCRVSQGVPSLRSLWLHSSSFSGRCWEIRLAGARYASLPPGFSTGCFNSVRICALQTCAAAPLRLLAAPQSAAVPLAGSAVLALGMLQLLSYDENPNKNRPLRVRSRLVLSVSPAPSLQREPRAPLPRSELSPLARWRSRRRVHGLFQLSVPVPGPSAELAGGDAERRQRVGFPCAAGLGLIPHPMRVLDTGAEPRGEVMLGPGGPGPRGRQGCLSLPTCPARALPALVPCSDMCHLSCRRGGGRHTPLPLARTPPSLSGSLGSRTGGRARCWPGPSARLRPQLLTQVGMDGDSGSPGSGGGFQPPACSGRDAGEGCDGSGDGNGDGAPRPEREGVVGDPWLASAPGTHQDGEAGVSLKWGTGGLPRPPCATRPGTAGSQHRPGAADTLYPHLLTPPGASLRRAGAAACGVSSASLPNAPGCRARPGAVSLDWGNNARRGGGAAGPGAAHGSPWLTLSSLSASRTRCGPRLSVQRRPASPPPWPSPRASRSGSRREVSVRGGTGDAAGLEAGGAPGGLVLGGGTHRSQPAARLGGRRSLAFLCTSPQGLALARLGKPFAVGAVGLCFGLRPGAGGRTDPHVAAAMLGAASWLAAAGTVPPAAVPELLGVGQSWQRASAPRRTQHPPLPQIRDEDRGPPPSPAPLLLSVIPGGFIKQLVRETEKEAKAAKLKKESKASAKEEPVVDDGEARARDPPAAGGAVAGEGQPLQNGLHAEGQGGQGVPAPPRKELPPGKAAPGAISSKTPSPAPSSAPAAPQPTQTPPKPAKPLCPEKSPRDPCPVGSPPAPAPTPSKGPQRCGKVPAKEGDAPKGTGPQSTKKEKGTPPSQEQHPAKARAQREPAAGPAGKGPEKMKKDIGGGKKEPREVKKPGKTVNKSEGPKGEPGGIQEKSEDVAKEVGKEKEEPGESTELGESVDKEQAPRDVWYEAEKVWLVQRDGFTLATQLKPDVGTPELPAGRVRVRREVDGSITEVDEDSVQRTNPPSLDYAEDLAALVSLNACSALHTLQHRYRARLPCTFAGPSLLAIRPGFAASSGSGKAFKGKRDCMPPHICSVAQRAYRNLLMQRQDQAIVPLGRSGAGRTTCCRSALEYLVGTAGSVDGRVSVEKIQAMFTVLGAFGSVTTGHSSSSTRFSMVLSLDFSATGRITAAHLQTMLLERGRVARQPHGESNFNVFPLMLAGLDAAQRTTLHLHQAAESNSFGIQPFVKPEEKQKASAAFAQLRAAMATLGITAEEQAAVWRVLAGIYHLGAAGACKVGRKQFMKFERASDASEVLGCDPEELTTAVFKHHLKQILAQATARGQRLQPAEESPAGPKMTGVECVEGMASGLYEELFAAIVSLINRSFSSQHLSMASIAVVDTPGFHNPRHQRSERAATFEELCHNYVHERLQALFYEKTFVSEMERYREENVEVSFDLPERSPLATLSVIDLSSPQPQALPGSTGADRRGLLWILDEEVLIPGSGDGAAFDRLCSYFATKGPDQEGDGHMRRCEQALHFEISHQLGMDPVRYDFTGWLSKAKLNLSALNAIQVLQRSKVEAVKELVLPRSRAPLACRAVAGLEGHSQAALHRNACVRKTFASSFAAVKKRSVCAQLKLQADALVNLLRRSQLHFVHCLVPGAGVEGPEGPVSRPPTPPDSALRLDVPTLRAQLEGTQLLDALRLHRIGYADRLLLTQFRRRFQVLAPDVMKKHTSAYEVPDESKAIEELFQALDLEKRSVAVGRSQVFLKPGVISRLEKQRDKLIAQKMILLQAACRGFLSRQMFKRLKIQRLAVRCIQKNLVVFQAVRCWPWWQLLSRVRPLLSVNLAEEQLRAKEEELAALRRKLEKSEQACGELRQTTERLESKIIDLTTELSDERYKGDVACQALDGERAERLRGARELQELQSKHDQVQKKLELVEKQLEEAQQLVQLREMKISGSGGEDEWQVRFDCAQTEIAFLRKRLAQLEERLEAELGARTGLEQKLGEAQAACEAAKKVSQQLRRRCRRLACELEDARVLAESQQARSHELEKRQKKFDLQLAQALGESAFEKSLREKVTQENTSIRWEMGKLQQSLEQKEAEAASLAQRATMLAGRVQELSTPSALDTRAMPALKKQLWDLEASAAEQRKELERQTAAVDHLEELHQRLELEIERMKQIHQKELEDKDEELEDVRQSCQRRLRQLEVQLEQEYEEKQVVLHEKQDLEGLIGTLCEQIGHRDFDVEKRLRRDLRRTRALLADVQLLLAAPGEPGAGTQEQERLRKQLEESEAKCAEAQRVQQTAALELENLHAELETLSRNKTLVDEQLCQLQRERADLLKRVEEDQEDLNELMAKHKALIAQSATDIAQIRELQTQVEDVKKEKQSLQEKLQAAQARAARLEQCPAERSVVSRQEARIRDLESQLDFQAVQMKRFEVLVLRLRDSIIKMGEELEKAAESEAREKESTRYYQRRMEEMKADMDELVQRELESSRRRVELEQQLAELAAVRQVLQADLGTSIRRIADLQVALEELRSSDESDAESMLTTRESLCSRRETDACSSVGSMLSLEPAESIKSWPGSSAGWSSPAGTSVAGSVSAQSVGSRSTQGSRVGRDTKDPALSRPPSSRSTARSSDAVDAGRMAGPLLGARRQEYGKPPAGEEEPESLKKPVERLGETSPSVLRRGGSPAPDGRFPGALSPTAPRRRGLSPAPSSSAALSEYVEELRRQRGAEREQGRPALGDTSPLPIYRTTGAAALRRCRAFPAAEDSPGKLGGNQSGEGEGAGAGLMRLSSQRSVASEPAEPARSPVLKRASKFGSYDSLLQNLDSSGCRPSSSAAGMEAMGVLRPGSWRSYLEPSLEDVEVGRGSGGLLGSPSSDGLGEGKGSDPFTWRIPTLNYERRTNVDFDDFLPAIRKSRSTSSLAKPGRDRKDGHRPLTVRFQDEAIAAGSASCEMKAPAKRSLAPRDDPGELSDSSSSGSVLSSRSADSIKRQPRPQRGDGEGSSSKAGTQSSGASGRVEAEGKEDDVSSIMRKYLGKD
ncbi:unconventional myosin-XVIIIb [Chlamydotis macqueenii]